MSEKIEIKVVALKDGQSFQTIEQDLKQLEQPRAAEIALNLTRAKRELQEFKDLQKEAFKAGDLNLAEKIGTQVELASKKVTTINRQLTNFQRTANENTSVLGNMFGSVESKMKQMFSGVTERLDNTYIALAKIGKNTSGIELLRKRAEELEVQMKNGEVSIKQYTEGLEKIGAEAQKVYKHIQNGGGILGSFNGLLSHFNLSIAKIASGAGLVSLGTNILNLGDKLEQANISFEVMLGSADKAKKMLADLSEFAGKTPFELQGIRDSAKQLMAMGIPAEKMIKTLKVLGDISAGTGAPLQQIAYAYGQVATAGVATTQDMNQLVNAGIPIWKELGKVVGVTASEVKKMVEGRQITFEQVETALTNMTEKGGQFADLMEAQSKTLSGQWNAFKDSLGAIGEKIGLAVIPVFKLLLEAVNAVFSFFGSAVGKITLVSAAFVGLIGIIGGLITGVISLSGVFTGLAGTAAGATVASWSLAGALGAVWAVMSPLLVGLAAVGSVVGIVAFAWYSLQNALKGLGGFIGWVGQIFDIEPIRKFGEALSWCGQKVQEFGKWVSDSVVGLWDWATGTGEAENSTKKLADTTELATQKVQEWEKSIQKTEESLSDLEQSTRNTDAIFAGLQQTVNNLIEEKEKLRTELQEGKITIDEYNLKLAETEKKLIEAKESSDTFSEALKIVHNNQDDYMTRVAKMKALKLNPGMYDALIQKLRAVAEEASRALQLKAQLLDQAIHNPVAKKTAEYAMNVLPGMSVAKGLVAGLDVGTKGEASKKIQEGGKKFMDFLKGEFKKTTDEVKKMETELPKLNEEAEKAKKDADAAVKALDKTNKKKGGGGGKSGKSKETEEAKKAQKAEEELGKARTNAYKEASKRVEKFNDAMRESNKKLNETATKWKDIKKEALEAIKDIDEKLNEKKETYQEKMAKRYSETFKELKEFFRKDGLRAIYASYTNDDFKKMFAEWQVNENDESDLAKNLREFQFIQKTLAEEELKLAVKKEQRSEAEKLTEEYEKQKALLESGRAMNEAVNAGRYMTTPDGEMSFYDENWNRIEAKDRSQAKEFRDKAKKIQDIANEELKIYAEQQTKMSEILKNFETERNALNNEYFQKDKEMRLKQHQMMEEYFAAEIGKMQQFTHLVANLGKSIPGKTDNNQNIQYSSDLFGEKIGQKSDLFAQEADDLKDRKEKNSALLEKYNSLVEKSESNITAVTSNEIGKRMSLYQQEEDRLDRIITKRLQAGYSLGVTSSSNVVNNTITHAPNISVNATSTQNIDVNTLANRMIKKVENYYKGINN